MSAAGTLFVTGTGTEIGKTLVAAALCHELRTQGRAVRALKPVLSGYDPAAREESDPGVLLASLGEPATEETVAELEPAGYWVSEERNGEWTKHGDYLLPHIRSATLFGTGPAYVETWMNAGGREVLAELQKAPTSADILAGVVRDPDGNVLQLP